MTQDLNQMREHMLTAIAAASGLDALEACRVEALGDAVRDGFAQTLDDWPLHEALVGGHLAERLQQRGDRALLAERLDPARLQRVEAGCRGDRRQHVFAHLVQVLRHCLTS